MKLRWKCGQPFSALRNMYLQGKKPAWMTTTFLKGTQKMNSVVSQNSSHTLQAKIQFLLHIHGTCIIKH